VVRAAGCSHGILCLRGRALRFFYGVTLGHDAIPERITCARQPHQLPVVLSADEVYTSWKQFQVSRAAPRLTTVYAAGLRVSKVVLQKITDIDGQRMVIRVEQGKGGRDRYVILSPQLLRILRSYLAAGPAAALDVPRP
jgi:integrase/recombinase XerD